MSDDQVSYQRQAETVEMLAKLLARHEVVKLIRPMPRQVEVDEHLRVAAAAVATLRMLARKAKGAERERGAP